MGEVKVYFLGHLCFIKWSKRQMFLYIVLNPLELVELSLISDIRCSAHPHLLYGYVRLLLSVFLHILVGNWEGSPYSP